MPITSVANLVEELQRTHLLDADQLGAVGEQLQPRCADPRALAKELLQRGWLTSFQINRLFQGRSKELILGSYVLLEPLGEGGMGLVFKARHLCLDRIDAVKIIRKELLANPNSIQRFQREARAAARLSHPNVIDVHDAGEEGNVHFLAMEYVAGTDLGRLVKKSGPLPVDQACNYILQAALGLQHAHERGLVHRDIKPSNLLLTSDGGTVKVLDMGLARLQGAGGDPSKELTETGTVVGTPDYIAPEQARNSKDADIRADVYSLGCTLYFLLTGHGPFTGETVTEKLLKHQLEDAPSLEILRPEVPPELAAIVRKLMAKRPNDRYQTPAEVVEVLAPFAGISSTDLPSPTALVNITSTPPLALPMATPVEVAAETLTGVQAQPSNPQGRRSSRPRLLAASIAGTVVFILGLAVGVLWLPGRGSVAQQQSGLVPPQTTARLDPKLANEALNRGLAAYDAKKYDQAIKEFSDAISLNPSHALAHFHRGEAHQLKGDLDLAIADFTVTIELDPKYDQAYFRRAMAYGNKRDFQKAIADHSYFIRRHPDDAAAYHNRGIDYHEQGKDDLAIDDFTTAIRLYPEYASAYAHRATILLQKRRFEAVLADCAKAIELEPTHPGVYRCRGIANYYCKNYELALADLSEAIKQQPKDALAYFCRSRVHEKMGDLAMSVADYNTAAKLDRGILSLKKD